MVFSRKDDRLKSMEEILKNAPADSSHVSISGVYYFINCGDAMQYHEPAERWIESSGIRHLCRSLDDIRTQIQLIEKNEGLEARVAELELKCLSSEVIDLVRCGIGGNYGGDCYQKAMDKYYQPLIELKGGS